MSGIAFTAQGVPHAFRDKPRVRRWLHSVAQDHGRSIDVLNLVLLSDEDLRQYNMRFLDRHYFTDVIAFDNSAGTAVNGDILISYHRTKENASGFSVSHQEELRRVMLHGLLHLLGHQDRSEEQKASMRRIEDAHLKRY